MSKPDALALADQIDAEAVSGRVSNHNGRQAAAELRRLHAENEALETMNEQLREQNTAVDMACARYEVENEALRKDAERYRWLKQEHERFDPVCHLSWKKGHDRDGSEWVNTHSLNVAIDAAMKEQA